MEHSKEREVVLVDKVAAVAEVFSRGPSPNGVSAEQHVVEKNEDTISTKCTSAAATIKTKRTPHS